MWHLPDEYMQTGGWYRDPAIDRDNECLPLAIKILEEADSLDEADFSSIKDSTLRRELLRLKATLLYWESLDIKGHVGSGRGILLANLRQGRKYCETLSDASDYSIRLSAGVHTIAKDDFPIESMEIRDIDQFFSPYHLINFSDVSKDDIPLISDETFISENNLEAFREKAREYCKPIPDDIRLDDIDYLKQLGNQTTATDRPRGARRLRKTEARFGSFSQPNGSPFIFERVVVAKNAFEARDCVIPDENTLNTVLLLEKVARESYDVPSDTFNRKDFSFLEGWLTGNNKWTYIQSDQKKCGLTFPLKLINILFEVIDEISGTSFSKLMHDGYFRGRVIDPKSGESWTFKRGTGLGMMNGATSVAVSIVFEIWRESFPEDERPQGLFYNDDQVIRFRKNTYNFAEAQVNGMALHAADWDEHMAQFGMNVHKKKPFVSRSGVFLEVYGKDFPINMQKRTQKVGNLFKALSAVNICHAKEIFSSTVETLDESFTDDIYYALSVVSSFWGCEFQKDEVSWPYELGGWMRNYEYGKNTILVDMLKLSVNLWNRIAVGCETLKSPESELPPRIEVLRGRIKEIADISPLASYSIARRTHNASRLLSSKGRDKAAAYRDLARRRKIAFLRKEVSPREYMEKTALRGHYNGNYLYPELRSDKVMIAIDAPSAPCEYKDMRVDRERLWAAFGSRSGKDLRVDLYPEYHKLDSMRILYGIVNDLRGRFGHKISVADFVLDLYTDFSTWSQEERLVGGYGMKDFFIQSINIPEIFEELTGIKGAEAHHHLVPIHEYGIVDVRTGFISPDFTKKFVDKYGEYEFAAYSDKLEETYPNVFKFRVLESKLESGYRRADPEIDHIMQQLAGANSRIDEVFMREVQERPEVVLGLEAGPGLELDPGGLGGLGFDDDDGY